ncbi:hypothetical protein, partial [Mycoplasma leonicaptivi]|uniref:hypothetical protein n=1 Tax=Mycoplasma leonicaptivi TaxID=36742 RepID=UPI00056CD03B
MKKYFNSNKIMIISLFLFYILIILSSSLITFFITQLLNNLDKGDRHSLILNIVITSVLTIILLSAKTINMFLLNKWNIFINQNLNKDFINKISNINSYEIEINKEGKYLAWIKYRIPEL